MYKFYKKIVFKEIYNTILRIQIEWYIVIYVYLLLKV